MIKELIKLSTHLDDKGCHKEADYLDVLVKRASYQDRMMEERNYMMDSRTNATDAWEGFDPGSNTIEVSWTRYLDDDEMTQIEGTEEWVEEEEVTLRLPAIFELCDLCSGSGSVVNPSQDASGLSEEDFERDPDFEEEYKSGRYDITCPQCRGKRVIPVINYEGLSVEQKKKFDDYQREQAEAAADAESDRRTYMAEMGYGY